MGQGGAQSDPYEGMNPIDAYKLSTELANARTVSPEKASKNRKQNLKDALSITPIVGNAIAAYDATQSGGQAVDDFSKGDYASGALNTGMAGLSGLGAVLGLPVGRMARSATKDAGRRTNVFVPGDDAPNAPKARERYDEIVDEQGMTPANQQVFDETGLFYGPEGALRREIPDAITFKTTPQPGDAGRLDEFIDHPELFDFAPELRGHPVRFTDADISTGKLTARTDPDTGAFEVAASQTEPQLRAQFAKLLQYKLDPKGNFANAGRETAKNKITEAKNALDQTRQAIDDGIIPAEYGERYMRELQKALDTSDAIRTTSTVQSGTPAGDFAAASQLAPKPGQELTNKVRRELQKAFWTKHSAGNQQVKAVKHRAYHQKGGYPYDPRATSIEDQISIPRQDLNRKQFADFVTRWNEYGSGRGKR